MSVPNLQIHRNIARLAAFLCALLVFPSLFARPQQFAKADRDYAQEMLKNVAADVQKYYYDPKLHGVDWDAQVRETKTKIAAADSMNSAVSEIAALLDTLNDSHTNFIPPPRATTHEYGFRMQMIGDHCFVTRVRPDSDAAKKGLKPGDEVLSVNDHPVSRQNFWRMEYIYNTLRPQPGLRLTLAAAPGASRQLDVMAKTKISTVVRYFQHQGINQQVRDMDDWDHSLRARYFEKGDELLVVKFPEFDFSAEEADSILAKMRKHKGVVLDLRGDPGGFTDTLDRLLGGIFQYDRKICDRIGRKSDKPIMAIGRHHDAYTGRFAVLIDSGSASASELFARAVQLEKRGFIVGDRSAGMVMESRFYAHETYLDSQVAYGATVTDADLVMTDGKSLEHVGVEPDILVLPTGVDLADQKDPAMAKAASLVGGHLTPEEAGAAFSREDPNPN